MRVGTEDHTKQWPLVIHVIHLKIYISNISTKWIMGFSMDSSSPQELIKILYELGSIILTSV